MMFWFLDYEVTKWFMALMLLSSLTSAVLISLMPWRRWIKALAIPIIVLQIYPAALLTDAMLGKPRPSAPEFNGTVSGYSVFQKNKSKRIAILISESNENRPLTIDIPWSDKMERQLTQAMKDIVNGKPTGIRIKSSQEDQIGLLDQLSKLWQGGSRSLGNNDQIEMYNFVQQFLREKEK